MAFLKFTVNKMIDKKDHDGNITSIDFLIAIEDDDPPVTANPISGGPGLPEVKTISVSLTGSRLIALPPTDPARQSYLTAFLKAEVAQAHAAWIQEIAARPQDPVERNSAEIVTALGTQEFTSLT